MLAGYGDNIAALVGSLGRLVDGRIAYDEIGLSVDMVRNGSSVFYLVDI